MKKIKIVCPNCGNVRFILPCQHKQRKTNLCLKCTYKETAKKRRKFRPNLTCSRCKSHNITSRGENWRCSNCGKMWKKQPRKKKRCPICKIKFLPIGNYQKYCLKFPCLSYSPNEIMNWKKQKLREKIAKRDILPSVCCEECWYHKTIENTSNVDFHEFRGHRHRCKVSYYKAHLEDFILLCRSCHSKTGIGVYYRQKRITENCKVCGKPFKIPKSRKGIIVTCPLHRGYTRFGKKIP